MLESFSYIALNRHLSACHGFSNFLIRIRNPCTCLYCMYYKRSCLSHLPSERSPSMVQNSTSRQTLFQVPVVAASMYACMQLFMYAMYATTLHIEFCANNNKLSFSRRRIFSLCFLPPSSSYLPHPFYGLQQKHKS